VSRSLELHQQLQEPLGLGLLGDVVEILMRAVLTLAALLMVAGCLPPPPIVRSVDLSQVRIGADRAPIERSLGLPESQSTAAGERTIVVYRYGPQVDPGDIFVCEPTSLGMLFVGCPMMNASNRAAAEAAASHEATLLGASLLQVVYDPNDRADWVIFAGDAATLARTSTLIARAECGNSVAQAELGRSLADGAGGLPLDRAEAYRWTALAARGGNADAATLQARLAASVDPADRQRLDAEVASWTPPSTCE
jgi:hypothetical protein